MHTNLLRNITMTKSITISFTGPAELKELLERWAAEDDRPVSSILRQILKKEAERRTQAQEQNRQVQVKH